MRFDTILDTRGGWAQDTTRRMQNNNRRINLRIKRIAGSSLNKFGEGKFSISNQRQEKRKKSGKQVYGNQVRKGKSVFACCCSELSSSSSFPLHKRERGDRDNGEGGRDTIPII